MVFRPCDLFVTLKADAKIAVLPVNFSVKVDLTFYIVTSNIILLSKIHVK